MDTKARPGSSITASTDALIVKVAAPYRSYFEGLAASVSAANSTGPFDILPGHHNFLSLLSPCEVVIRTQQGEQQIKIARGIIHVRDNKVTVFLDI